MVTVMSLGMWEVAYSTGHQLKPPPVRMDRTRRVSDKTVLSKWQQMQ